MTLFSRIAMSLGTFLILTGVVYGLVAGEYEGLTEMLTVAGGALLVGVYLTRAVQRARATLAAQAAAGEAGDAGPGAGDTEPHVAPTIWPLVFAVSMIGLVLGAVGFPWALAIGGVLLAAALVGWSLDVRRQWHHHDHVVAAGAARGEAHRQTGQ
ncbi:MAG TPA: cytochrome c oxidase subunit 4 [Streptosporangiaceae bacterium]